MAIQRGYSTRCSLPPFRGLVQDCARAPVSALGKAHQGDGADDGADRGQRVELEIVGGEERVCYRCA